MGAHNEKCDDGDEGNFHDEEFILQRISFDFGLSGRVVVAYLGKKAWSWSSSSQISELMYVHRIVCSRVEAADHAWGSIFPMDIHMSNNVQRAGPLSTSVVQESCVNIGP